MDFLWIVLLFLGNTEPSHLDEMVEINTYISIIKDFRDLYNFNEILIIYLNGSVRTESLLTEIFKIPQMTFNVVPIHDPRMWWYENIFNASLYLLNYNRKLLLYIVEKHYVFHEFYENDHQRLGKCRVKMIIALKGIRSLLTPDYFYYTDTVFIIGMKLYKYESFRMTKTPMTISDFFSNDSDNNPEANLP